MEKGGISKNDTEKDDLHKRGKNKFGVSLLTAAEDNLETNRSTNLDQGN